MSGPIQIRLFGGLSAELTEPPRIITRYRSRNIASLLAYLALGYGVMHSRDELADLIWPDSGLDVARNNLRVALSSLRRQLEPPGIPAGTVIRTEGRARVGLNPATIWVDVAEFENFIRRSQRAELPPAPQIALLEEAVQLCQGPLLPGFYDDWAVLRRSQLQASLEIALSRLAALYGEAGNTQRVAELTCRAIDLCTPHGSLPRDRETVSVRTSCSHDATAVIPAKDVRPAHVPNLPVFLTRFFGRESELESLVTLLKPQDGSRQTSPGARLVTLTGPGGSGKTRLALQSVARTAAHFPGGVFWAALTEASDADQIADAVVNAVEASGRPVDGSGSGRLLDRAVEALASDRASLLVLDNFEHLVEVGTPVVEELLAGAPNVSCLVTSRQRLMLGSEREFPVPPLPTPPLTDTGVAAVALPEASVAPEQLMTYTGVQLFVDRAQAARPDFQLTARNASAVGALCARLEGLPLALELAAGWSLTLTPEQMLARLEQQELELLVARRRDIPPRHRSLRAVLESSYHLLEPDLQRLLARLSVFRGTWTAEAVEAVCSEDEREHPRILDGLTQLRERSLLLIEEREGNMRMRLLLLVRTFAGEQLADADREVMETRHACYFLARAEEAETHLRGGPLQTQWIKALEADLDNIRAVLTRSRTAHSGWPSDLPLRLTGALGWFWVMQGHWREGLQWLREALARSSNDSGGGSIIAPSPARAKALYAASMSASALNLFEECRACCTESLQICRRTGDTWGAAFSTAQLGAIAARQGQYEEGRSLLEEGLSGMREIGERWGTAFILDNLAHACRDQQDYERAAALYEESLSLRKEMEDQQGIAMSLSNLADTEQFRGDWERAAVLHEASLERFRQIGDKAGIGYGLRRLGECALQQGDIACADTLNRESITLFRELGDKRRIAECLEKTALLRQVQGQGESAARLFGAAGALRATIGMPLPPSEKQAVEDSIAALHTSIGPGAVSRAVQQGQTMDLEAALVCALEAVP